MSPISAFPGTLPLMLLVGETSKSLQQAHKRAKGGRAFNWGGRGAGGQGLIRPSG